MIAAAGNPVEYNKSVREFDMVTLDRVRMISIEADDKIWKEYARNQDIHGALLSYLEIRPNNFYRAQADVDGMQYVTARGWEDFSYLLRSYEKMQLPVSEELFTNICIIRRWRKTSPPILICTGNIRMTTE